MARELPELLSAALEALADLNNALLPIGPSSVSREHVDKAIQVWLALDELVSFAPAQSDERDLLNARGPELVEAGRIAVVRILELAPKPGLDAPPRSRYRSSARGRLGDTAVALGFWTAIFAIARAEAPLTGAKILKTVLDRSGNGPMQLFTPANALKDDRELKEALTTGLKLLVDGHYPISVLLWPAYDNLKNGHDELANLFIDMARQIQPANLAALLGKQTLLAREILAPDTESTRQQSALSEMMEIQNEVVQLAHHRVALRQWRSFEHMSDRNPLLVSTAALAEVYIGTERWVEARRLLRPMDLSARSPLARQLRELLAQVNDVLAGQVESGYAPHISVGVLSQEVEDSFKAVTRRIELLLNLGARETTMQKILELVSERTTTTYPTAEAVALQQLAANYGGMWGQIEGAPRQLLVAAETLFAQMAPTRSGAASLLVQAYASAYEGLLKSILGSAAGRLPLGTLAHKLREAVTGSSQSQVDPVTVRVRQQLDDPAFKPHRVFWSEELPAELDGIVRLRNAAAHGTEVPWDELEDLRQRLIGKDAPNGLIGRTLAARG